MPDTPLREPMRKAPPPAAAPYAPERRTAAAHTREIAASDPPCPSSGSPAQAGLSAFSPTAPVASSASVEALGSGRFDQAADVWWTARALELRAARQSAYGAGLAHLRARFGRRRMTDSRPTEQDAASSTGELVDVEVAVGEPYEVVSESPYRCRGHDLRVCPSRAYRPAAPTILAYRGTAGRARIGRAMADGRNAHAASPGDQTDAREPLRP